MVTYFQDQLILNNVSHMINIHILIKINGNIMKGSLVLTFQVLTNELQKMKAHVSTR